MRIHDARNRAVVHVVVPAVDVIRHVDPFLFRLVREHVPEGHVANALDVRYARVELVVDHDAPARVDFDADVFDAETFDVGRRRQVQRLLQAASWKV